MPLGAVINVAFTPDYVWLYASSSDNKIYYLQFTDPRNMVLIGDGSSLEFDSTSKMWILNQQRIEDKEQNDYTGTLQCQDFAVDDTFLVCVNTDGYLHKKLKTISGNNIYSEAEISTISPLVIYSVLGIYRLE